MDDLISREGAIRLYCREHCGWEPEECGFTLERDGTEDCYSVRFLKELPSAQQWIPCSERLPEESGRYLVSVLDGVGRRTTVAPYQPRYKAWTMTGRMAYWKVIAWMPLPEPYRAERRADEKKDI